MLTHLLEEYAHVLDLGALEVKGLRLSVMQARRLFNAAAELIGPAFGGNVYVTVVDLVHEELRHENWGDDEMEPLAEAQWSSEDRELLRKVRALTPAGEAYVRDAVYRLLRTPLKQQPWDEALVLAGLAHDDG